MSAWIRHTCKMTSSACLEGQRTDIPLTTKLPNTQILVSKTLHSNKRNQGSLEKWTILGLEHHKYKVRQERPVVLESEKILRKAWQGLGQWVLCS